MTVFIIRPNKEFNYRGIVLNFVQNIEGEYIEINNLPFTLGEFFIKWYSKGEFDFLPLYLVDKLGNMTDKELKKLIDTFLTGERKND